MQPITENELSAMTMLMFVMTPCTAARRTSIPISTALNGVNGQELAWLKNGISALLQHQLLGHAGSEIGVSNGGKAFLAYVTAAQADSPTLAEDIKDHPVLDPIRAAIASDARFTPPPKNSENSIEVTDTPSIFNVWTILFFIIVALGLFQLIKAIVR